MTKFQRKKKNKANAILTADWHLRSDVPVCRTDDFFKEMEGKIDFILALAKEHGCPILVAGDLGDKPQWRNWLLEWAINKFKGYEIICIPGQHDLPNHRLDLSEKSGVGVLHAAEAAVLLGPRNLQSDWEFDGFWLDAFPYGENIHHVKPLNKSKPQMAMTHEMIIENRPLFPDQEAPKAHQILKKFPEYDLILSGDNHNPFTAEHQGRKLVNPGSLMRSKADQEGHRPRVYLWHVKANEVEKVYLPIKSNVISRAHVEIAQNRENRNEAFIRRVNDMEDIELSFEKNLENYFEKYRTEKPIKNKVWKSTGQNKD